MATLVVSTIRKTLKAESRSRGRTSVTAVKAFSEDLAVVTGGQVWSTPTPAWCCAGGPRRCWARPDAWWSA